MSQRCVDCAGFPLPSARQDWKNGPAIAGCALTTARRALVAGSPRPEAETRKDGRRRLRRGAQIFSSVSISKDFKNPAFAVFIMHLGNLYSIVLICTRRRIMEPVQRKIFSLQDSSFPTGRIPMPNDVFAGRRGFLRCFRESLLALATEPEGIQGIQAQEAERLPGRVPSALYRLRRIGNGQERACAAMHFRRIGRRAGDERRNSRRFSLTLKTLCLRGTFCRSRPG